MMLWFPTVVRNQTLWQRERWWYKMPLLFFFLGGHHPPFELGVPQQGLLLVYCAGELGFLDTTLVLTGETARWETYKWWIGLEVPCCEKHQARNLTIQVRKHARNVGNGGVLSPAIPTANILQVIPNCSACSNLLKAKIAEHPLALMGQKKTIASAQSS